MRFADGQTFVNGHQPVMNRYFSSSESSPRWDWHKRRNLATAGAAISSMDQRSFEVPFREKSLNDCSSSGIFRTTVRRIQPNIGCSSWERFWIHWKPDFRQNTFLAQLLIWTKQCWSWQGRPLFKQYIPGKAQKHGVEIYKLAAANGYTWNLRV